jgi:hypothetical protein
MRAERRAEAGVSGGPRKRRGRIGWEVRKELAIRARAEGCRWREKGGARGEELGRKERKGTAIMTAAHTSNSVISL